MRPPEPYVVDGGVAVVTGAASGIGASLAELLARRGSHLVLVDKDKDALEQVADEARKRTTGRLITAYAIDLSEKESAGDLVARTLEDHGRATLIVNNAGVALGGLFEDVSMDDVDWLMAVNLRAVMAVTSAFLPTLQRDSHITNISSLFGLITPVGNATYAASKFGVRGFSTTIREELAPRGIGVTTVYPGGIKTNIARRARRGAGVSDEQWARGHEAFEDFLRIPPETAARVIMKGTERRRPRVVIGATAKMADVMARIAPTAHARIIEASMRAKGLSR